MFIEIALLTAAFIISSVFVFKAWGYHDKKKEQADLEAKKVINNAMEEADKILKKATQETNMRLQVIKSKEEGLNNKYKELSQYELDLNQKRNNLMNEQKKIEKKIARQNEFINKIKNIIMGEKKHKYDLQKWLRKIFMEYEV